MRYYTFPDGELIRLFASGSKEAFLLLFSKYKKYAFKIAMNFLKNCDLENVGFVDVKSMYSKILKGAAENYNNSKVSFRYYFNKCWVRALGAYVQEANKDITKRKDVLSLDFYYEDKKNTLENIIKNPNVNVVKEFENGEIVKILDYYSKSSPLLNRREKKMIRLKVKGASITAISRKVSLSPYLVRKFLDSNIKRLSYLKSV